MVTGFGVDPMDDFLRMMHILGQIPPTPPTQEESTTMGIEVGKIVLREGYDSGRYTSRREEENLVVSLDVNGIHLQTSGINADSPRAGLYGTNTLPGLTPQQAIELGQLLLKAAEVQPEYADEANRITEERNQMDVRYKDLLNGVGDLKHDVVVDVEDARSGFVLNKALT